jgi:hypothetical protein
MSTSLFAQTNALEFANLLVAARRCHPFWERGGRLTFPGGRNPDQAWQDWIAQRWQPTLQPALQDALLHARHGAFRELCHNDHLLDQQLPADMGRRSIREARLLWQSLRPPQGERLLEKMRHAIVQASTPGHFLPLFAARAAAFHLSDQLTTATYLFLEAWPILQGAPAVRLQGWLLEAGIDLPAPGSRELLPASSASDS